MRKIRRWFLTKKRALINALINGLVKITHKLRMASISTYRKINLTFTPEERVAKYEKAKEVIMANAPLHSAFLEDEEDEWE